MPLLTYEFLPDVFLNPESKKLGVVYRPYVLVKLGNGERWSKNFIRALVDTGADNNLFPIEFANEIGIDYKKGKRWKIVGVGRQEVHVYIIFAKIKIDRREFETMIQFGEHIRTPLLGREGFLNYFDRVSFNVKKRFLELKY